MTRYDNHLLLTTLAEESERMRQKAITVIGKTMERFTIMTFEGFVVKDSCNFMATSLDKMVTSLKSKIGPDHRPEQVFGQTLGFFRKRFPEYKYPRLTDAKLVELLLQKGYMPYEYVSSDAVLAETELPPRWAFTSKLKHGEGITEQQYAHAKEMWDCFEMKTFKDYLQIYCILDTLLLADSFEEFRSLCLTTFRLDPCHFHTAPSLAWNAALLESNVKLEVIRDTEMLDFLNRALLGGYSAVHHQFAQANHPDIPNYDSTLPTSSIITLDANNLYGYAMSQYLPTGDFAWDTEVETYTVDRIMNWSSTAERSAFLEVDLHYPSGLHNDHNDLPCAPENIVVGPHHLSTHQNDVAAKLDLKLGGKKLVTQLTDKTKYVLHMENLKQYLDLGLVLTKVHRVLTFSQSPWLASYIRKCTKGRRRAKFKFLRDLYKLIVNAVYGKTVENVLKYRNIVVCLEEDKFNGLVTSPLFQAAKIHGENFVTVEMKRVKHKMDKPRYVGIAVLALAKVHLYQFHYKTMKKLWPKSRLLFTDTDSLAYALPETPAKIYRQLKECDVMDYSNFDPEHEFYDETHQMEPGYWKDENAGKTVSQFVGLRSKMYSFDLGHEGSKSTAKGVQRAFQEKHVTHKHYFDVLFQTKTTNSFYVRLQNEGHVVYTRQGEKLALNPLNDKRFINKDGYSFAFGHVDRCE